MMKNLILSLFLVTALNSFGTVAISDCNAAFEYTVDGMTVTFIDASAADPGPILEWTWDFGDGTTSTDENPVHTYAFPGEYDVCLTIHADGACYDTKCESNIPVEMGGGCFTTFTFVTDGLSAMFTSDTDPGPGDVVSYAWTFGDGGTSAEANPDYTYDISGAYLVCLVVTFADGCTAEFCNEVLVDGVGADCMVTAEVTGVVGANHHFYASVTPAADEITYTWYFDDGTTFTETTAGTASDPWHEYATSGVYNVCVVIETGAGCIDEYCFEIVVDGGGDCIVTAEVTGVVGANHHFYASVTPDADEITYTWYFDEGTTFTETTAGTPSDPWHEYATPGVYNVCVVIETGAGCIDEYCFEIIVDGGGDCEAAFEFSTDMVTASFFETADGAGSDIISYFWDFGDGSTSTDLNPTHVYTLGGTYLVCLTITTADGCVNTVCEEVDVEGVGGDCEAKFDIVSITDTGSGWVVELDNNSTGSEIYAWTFGDGGTSDTANPEHLYEEAGIYTICLTIGIPGTDCFDEKCEEVFVGGGVDCINPATIDSTYGCIDVYEPVCGCDGITYDNSCYAIYYGGVVFYTDGACGGVSVQEETIIGTIRVQPNPAQNNTTINYAINAGGLVTIQVMDLTGKIMLTPIEHYSIPGTYNVELNTGNLSSGLYIINIATNGENAIEKLVISK